MPKKRWIVLLCLLLLAGAASDRYNSVTAIPESITVTAPFNPQYTPNEKPQSSVKLAADLCGITRFQNLYGTTGDGQRIALIDSGIDLSHSAFQNRKDGTVKAVVYRDYTQEGLLQTQEVICRKQQVAAGGTVYHTGAIANDAAVYRLAFLNLEQMQPKAAPACEQQMAVLVTAQNSSQYNCVYVDTDRDCDFADEQPLRCYAERQQHITLQNAGYPLNLALTSIAADGSQIQLTADTLGHGTFLAGLMAANGKQYQGLAPQAQLCVYKIFDRNGQSSQQLLAKAIRQAILDDVDCINLSLSIPKDEPVSAELEEVLQQAQAANIPVIAAAGNYGPGKNTIACPARADNVIGVGSYVSPAMYALDRDVMVEDAFIADYSGRGKLNGTSGPLLVAPAGIISTVPGWYAESCLYDYGTSISAAITTAAICHVQEAAEKKELLLSVDQIKNLLAQWADNLEFPPSEQGYGALKLGRLPGKTGSIKQRAGMREETIVYTKEDRLSWAFAVPQGQSRSWYVEVPMGCKKVSAVVQMDQQSSGSPQESPIAMGRCYVSIYNPDGVLMDQSRYLGASYSESFITSDEVGAMLPQPGIWEVVVTSADNLSLYNHLESTGVLQIEME
ncbi:MAG: S8 family serine peptidase [Peptococcaceae bacterium]|nr:S8 family serine peptidase [Peptococcaceae bacterium]